MSFEIPPHDPFCIDTNSESAILVWNSKIYVNDDGNLEIYDLPGSKNISKPLSPRKVIEGRDWAYFIVPVNGKMVWGGSGTYLDGCAPINLFEQEKEIITLPNCVEDPVTEYYSIMSDGDSFLLGTYPSGSIFAIDEENSVSKKLNVYPQREKFRYFESQSILKSSGQKFIGLYPFGEVLYFDDTTGDKDTYSTFRLFSGPENDGEYLAPYYGEFLDEIEKRTGSRKISDADESIFRNEGIHPNLLGQRVPTSTVLDGRVCFSTGNFTFVEPAQEVISRIGNIDEYGKVHCLLMPNQTLLSTQETNKFQVNIHEKGISIFSSDNLLKIVRFEDISIPS